MALRQINACLGLYEIQAKGMACLLDICTLGSMVKKHGAEEGMVIQLLCFHRLLVLHLAACSAAVLRGVTVDELAMEDFCCWFTPMLRLIVNI